MAELNDITIYKGEAIQLNFTMSPVTDITGWSISFTVRDNANDAASVIQVAAVTTVAASGTFSVSLTHALTNALSGNHVYAYDVQRIDAGSEAVLSIGTFTVTQEVYYP